MNGPLSRGQYDLRWGRHLRRSAGCASYRYTEAAASTVLLLDIFHALLEFPSKCMVMREDTRDRKQARHGMSMPGNTNQMLRSAWGREPTGQSSMDAS
jgi:hypothetical protein